MPVGIGGRVMRTTEEQSFIDKATAYVDGGQSLVIFIAVSPGEKGNVTLDLIANTRDNAVLMHALRDAATTLYRQIRGGNGNHTADDFPVLGG